MAIGRYVSIEQEILPLFTEGTKEHKRVYDAWQRNRLTVVLCDGVFWFERTWELTNILADNVKKAMLQLGHKYLYDVCPVPTMK